MYIGIFIMLDHVVNCHQRSIATGSNLGWKKYSTLLKMVDSFSMVHGTTISQLIYEACFHPRYLKLPATLSTPITPCVSLLLRSGSFSGLPWCAGTISWLLCWCSYVIHELCSMTKSTLRHIRKMLAALRIFHIICLSNVG